MQIGIATALIGPGQCGERLRVMRIREQALLRQLDHLVDTIEAAMELHEDVAEDVLLLAAASAHRVELVDRRRHESYRRLEIALDDRDLTLEERDSQSRPVSARASGRHPAKPLDLLVRSCPVA